MEIEEFCPHCDKLIKVDVTEDYWEYKQGQPIDIDEPCPECRKDIFFSWEYEPRFDLCKKEC